MNWLCHSSGIFISTRPSLVNRWYARPKSYFSKKTTLRCHQTWGKLENPFPWFSQPETSIKRPWEFPSHLWHRRVNVCHSSPYCSYINVQVRGSPMSWSSYCDKEQCHIHFHSQFHRSDTSVLSLVVLDVNWWNMAVFWSDGWHGVLKWSCYLLDASIFTLAWDSWDDDLYWLMFVRGCFNHQPLAERTFSG